MANYALLNNVDHQNLKVITQYGPEYGEIVHNVLTFPSEYEDVQREFPIFFKKTQDNKEFQSVAILGFDKGENLFLDEQGQWVGSYIPGFISRGPFLIGFQEKEVSGELHREPVIHVNLDDPRVNESEGEPLFLEHGGNSPYLDRVANTLNSIRHGIEVGRDMFSAFDRYGLLEPVAVNIEIHADLHYNLSGFYTVSEERLAQLDGNALENLNRYGYLRFAFLVSASLRNVKRLIELKRRKLLRQEK